MTTSKFAPAIDVLEGKVTQIVGDSLGTEIKRNFDTKHPAVYFAAKFKDDGIKTAHIIMLDNSAETKQESLKALEEFPGGFKIGGGITPENAQDYLNAGASHVILNSYLVKMWGIDFQKLVHISKKIPKSKLIVDLSCKYSKREKGYYVAAKGWNKLTGAEMNEAHIHVMQPFCDGFLIHGVEHRGKKKGIDKGLVALLGEIVQHRRILPITYAGGIMSLKDIEFIENAGKGKLNYSVGSGLDLFGGPLSYEELVRRNK